MRSLEEKGFITRTQDPEDRRQNRLYVTELGKTMWPEVRGVLFQFNQQVIEGIDPKQVEIAFAVLGQIDRNITQLLKEKQ